MGESIQTARVLALFSSRVLAGYCVAAGFFTFVHFPYLRCSDMQPTTPKCRSCKRWVAQWDSHDLCPSCRSCSQSSRCSICRDWSKEWTWLSQGKDPKEKKSSKRKSSQAPSDQSKKSSKDSSSSKRNRESSKRRSDSKEAETNVSQVARTAPDKPQAPRKAPASQVARTAPDISQAVRTTPDSAIQSANPPDRDVGSARTASVSTTLPDRSVTPARTATEVESLPANPSAPSQPTVIDLQVVGLLDPDQPGPSGLSRADLTHLQIQPTPQGDHTVALKDILLASDSSTLNTRDFEGFVDQQPASPRRSRSRSRSHKSRRSHRRYSSSSSRSPSPRRRKRPRHESDKSAETLSQIWNMLSTLTQQQQQQHQPPQARSQPSSSASSVPSQPAAQGQAADDVPSEGSAISDDDQERVELLSIADNPASDRDTGDSGSEEEPLYGTDIPQDVFERAVEILRRQLGFDESDQPKEPPSKSKLSLNKPSTSSRASLPVDAECEDRYKATASSATAKKWTAFSKSQNTSFRVEEKEWKDLFKTPPVPQSAEDYLRSVGSLDFSGKLKSIAGRRTLQSLYQIDTAARTGLKFSSALLLIAEVLSKSFRQSGSSEVSRRDTATLVSLVGPIARRVYDQLSRVSVRSVLDRREVVLDNMRLPARDVRRRFLDLPISGEDLFGGQFDSQLQAEVKRKKDMQQASLSTPHFRPSQSRQRPPFSQRRRQPTQSSQHQPASNRFSTSNFRPYRHQQQRRPFSRNPMRGSSKPTAAVRGRSFSKP